MIILPSTLGLMLLLLMGRFGLTGARRLAALELAGGRWVVLAALAQAMSIWTHQARFALLLITGALLLGFCWRNRRRAGLALATGGVLLNLLVMAANGGAMPISPRTIQELSGSAFQLGTAFLGAKDIVLADDQAALALLGDRLLLPGPLRRLAAWSIGDVLLLAGVGRLLWTTMKGTGDDERTLWGGATPPRTRAADLRGGQQPAFRNAARHGA